MGCLNSIGQFKHWFGNIHFSGPCNAQCYFCIGQHMMALDPLNNLDSWPLASLDEFARKCAERAISEVNLTGSNTDPILYRHTAELKGYLSARFPDLVFGIRTNGLAVLSHPERWRLYDKASLSIHSLNPSIYKQILGVDGPPDVAAILQMEGPKDIKVNIVLCPEADTVDVLHTIHRLERLGVKRFNLREPYGQAHVGNPLQNREPDGRVLGMPQYQIRSASVVYWEVHFVEVESVNLYANGVVSTTYPITKGYHETGQVSGQANWQHGRHNAQWLNQPRAN
jgi:hypothetical protein